MKFNEKKWRTKAEIDADNLDLEIKQCLEKAVSIAEKMLDKSFLKTASLQEIHRAKAEMIELQKKVQELKRKQEKMGNLK